MKLKSKKILFVIIGILLVTIITSSYFIYKKVTKLVIFSSVVFKSPEEFNIRELFNKKVDLDDYIITYLDDNDNEIDIADEKLEIGSYAVTIKEKKSSKEYVSLISISDLIGPELSIKDNQVFNPNDYLEIATFVTKCRDNVSKECHYNLYDENGSVVNFFSHDEGSHNYLLEAYDDFNNKTLKKISYKIDSNVLQTSIYGVYRYNPGFIVDNPIAKLALAYVGYSGDNCEKFFNMILFNTQEVSEKMSLYKSRDDFKNDRRYEVSLLEALPGDELRYDNNGYGQVHVAIYIGNGMAVHGGFDSKDVVIYDAIMPGATLPRVYRYNI